MAARSRTLADDPAVRASGGRREARRRRRRSEAAGDQRSRPSALVETSGGGADTKRSAPPNCVALAIDSFVSLFCWTRMGLSLPVHVCTPHEGLASLLWRVRLKQIYCKLNWATRRLSCISTRCRFSFFVLPSHLHLHRISLPTKKEKAISPAASSLSFWIVHRLPRRWQWRR